MVAMSSSLLRSAASSAWWVHSIPVAQIHQDPLLRLKAPVCRIGQILSEARACSICSSFGCGGSAVFGGAVCEQQLKPWKDIWRYFEWEAYLILRWRNLPTG